MLSQNRGWKQNKKVRTVIEKNNNKNEKNTEDSSDTKNDNYNLKQCFKIRKPFGWSEATLCDVDGGW